MKVKEILNLNIKELKNMMSEEEYERMQNLNLEVWQLLDALKDSAKESGQDAEEEHTTISEYLDYLEDMRQ